MKGRRGEGRSAAAASGTRLCPWAEGLHGPDDVEGGDDAPHGSSGNAPRLGEGLVDNDGAQNIGVEEAANGDPGHCEDGREQSAAIEAIEHQKRRRYLEGEDVADMMFRRKSDGDEDESGHVVHEDFTAHGRGYSELIEHVDCHVAAQERKLRVIRHLGGLVAEPVGKSEPRG